MNLDEGVEIIIEDIEAIEDVEIEISCQGSYDVEAIEAPREDIVYSITEQEPVFEGDWKYLSTMVSNQIRFSETMKEGRTFVEFVVDTTGKMTDFRVIKNLSEENEKEVVRIMNLINQYHTWKPAENRSKKVKVRKVVPVIFKRKVKVEGEKLYFR